MPALVKTRFSHTNQKTKAKHNTKHKHTTLSTCKSKQFKISSSHSYSNRTPQQHQAARNFSSDEQLSSVTLRANPETLHSAETPRNEEESILRTTCRKAEYRMAASPSVPAAAGQETILETSNLRTFQTTTTNNTSTAGTSDTQPQLHRLDTTQLQLFMDDLNANSDDLFRNCEKIAGVTASTDTMGVADVNSSNAMQDNFETAMDDLNTNSDDLFHSCQKNTGVTASTNTMGVPDVNSNAMQINLETAISLMSIDGSDRPIVLPERSDADLDFSISESCTAAAGVTDGSETANDLYPEIDFVTITPNNGELKLLPLRSDTDPGIQDQVKTLVDVRHERFFVIHKQARKFVNRFGGVRKVEECNWSEEQQALVHMQPRTYLSLKWYEKKKIAELSGKVAEDPIFEIQTQFYLYRAGLTLTPPLLDLVQTREKVYAITEFVPKGSVIDYLCSGNNTWTTKEKLYVFRHMLLAAEQMHQLDMCHRDLSPENFLLREDWTPFVIDFGLAARISEARDSPHRGVGKSYCMAPELFRKDGAYDPIKADLWALGVCLVSILTNGGRIFGDCVLTSANYDPIVVRQDRNYLRSLLGCLVPDEVLDCLLSIFQVDPYARPKLGEIIGNPMFL